MVKKNTKKSHSNSRAVKQNGTSGSRTGSGNSSGGKTRKKTSDKTRESTQVTPPSTAAAPATNGASTTGTVSAALTNGAPPQNGTPANEQQTPEVEEQEDQLSAEEAEAQRLALVAERVNKVLHGRIDDLPKLCSKIVRIFTSSTFTDTTTERNALMENVYPKIKEFCRERHGLEFQVVDMRWGVRDEATDDHMTTELCMKEIASCQRLSVGPNFVVFLGQKYGYRPIPTIIPASEFDMICDVVKSNPDDLKLVQQWYLREDNAAPPVYVLQPISSILTNFINKRVQKLMEADQNRWWEIMERLQKMFRKAVQVLMMTRRMDRDQMHNYFMSVTEREVYNGILKMDAKYTKEHCVCYFRNIENVNLSAIRYARNFVDMIGKDVDKEAERLLNTLKSRVPEKICSESIVNYTVPWSGKEGIDRESHADYLLTFCEDFYRKITNLVDQGMITNRKLSDLPVYGEVLQHLHVTHTLCKVFQGRDTILGKMHDYIVGSKQSPLVMWGHSGCGKTSLLAKAYQQIPIWLPDKDPVLIIRFLGTSPDSSALMPLLTSLTQQILINYDQSIEEIPEDLSKLTQYFKKILNLADAERPLFIVMDSLDQVSSQDSAHQLGWLPLMLPENVKIIVSTLPNYFEILNTLRDRMPEEENYEEITPLGQELGSLVLKTWLAKEGRTVIEPQWKIVENVISNCNLPLFIRLVFDEVIRWRSYHPPKHTTLAANIPLGIMKLLDRVESNHGKILVSHALGYLTASKSGLSEAELEDLLSLDEKVLNDVYQYHLPPVRRIPPLLWTRIRNDLPEYLNEREADGVNVISWYHRQFVESSRERYFRNINFLREHHSTLADYFLGIWGGVPKPFEYSALQRQRFFLSETSGEGDRKVPEQPLYYTDDDGKILRFNLRKLSELPYHLMRAGRWEDLYVEVLFNVKFLFAKLSSMPLQTVVTDFENSLEYQYDKNVKVLADAIRLSGSVLCKTPQMIGPQIIGRLLPYYNQYDKITALIDQCDSEEGLQLNALSPSYHCLHTPGGPLQYSLEGHQFAPFGVGVTRDNKYLVSVSNIFVIWDLATADVFRQISPGIQGIMQNLVMSPDDRYSVSYTNNNQLIICSLMTGDFKIVNQPSGCKDDIIGTAINSKYFVAWTAVEYYIYTLDSQLQSRHKVDSTIGIPIFMEFVDGDADNADELLTVFKTQENKHIPEVETADDMALLFHGPIEVKPFYYHSAMAMTKDRRTLYACIAISDDAVACYKRVENEWKYDRTLGDNYDKLYALCLSEGDKYLAGVVALGFKVWDLSKDKLLELKLPDGIRNIPTKNQLKALVAFTKRNEFFVAAVRKNIYVWDVKVGNLVKTLDAHFGRIIAMTAVNDIKKLISSSIDKSVKVWNFDNILEDVHCIFRHEKSIDALSLASNAYIGATITRNCVGIWNLENGKLIKTLANSMHSSIITHAEITGDAKYVVSAESGNILIWSVADSKVLHSDSQRDVQQIILTDHDKRCVVLSKLNASTGKCVCRAMPAGDVIYEFEFQFAGTFKKAVMTSDGAHLVVPAVNRTRTYPMDVVSVYHGRTGNFQYEVQHNYTDYLNYTHIVAMQKDAHLVALIDEEKGNFIDLKKKTYTRSVKKWNGICTQNGRYGLYAPKGGGMELLELKGGKRVHTLIPRVAEGVFDVVTMFTKTDQYVIYYHTGHQAIRVFRTSDGKEIAHYKAHADIRAIASTGGGTSLVLGAVDGSVVVLVIADPKNRANVEFLHMLPSRQEAQHSGGDELGGAPSTSDDKTLAGLNTFGAFAQVARAAAKAKKVQKSRACVVQ